ncbi:MAG TPA: hypothetical protein VL403_00825 [Candidatus Kryptonia bacterium]|nr:hypothetical protein [Candidatus Kryptonia bacterium]
MQRRTLWIVSVVAAVLSGCTAQKREAAPQPLPTPARPVVDSRRETPVPTVPPETPAPLSTRPIPNPNVKATKGKPIGPIITHFGAAKADGTPLEPMSVGKDGIATYKAQVGSGFLLIIEAKPGLNNYEVARSIFNYDPNDPAKQPDLQLISSRPLGDGSEEVCDSRRPNIGGIPAVNPPSFKETQKVSDALNDMACRFEVFVDSASACTTSKNGNFSFVNPESTTQFGMIVARAWNFPLGTTLLTVRVRDTEGNPGPTKQIRVFRPKPPPPRPTPKAPKGPVGTPTPKPLPTR